MFLCWCWVLTMVFVLFCCLLSFSGCYVCVCCTVLCVDRCWLPGGSMYGKRLYGERLLVHCSTCLNSLLTIARVLT